MRSSASSATTLRRLRDCGPAGRYEAVAPSERQREGTTMPRLKIYGSPPMQCVGLLRHVKAMLTIETAICSRALDVVENLCNIFDEHYGDIRDMTWCAARVGVPDPCSGLVSAMSNLPKEWP